MTRPEPRHDDHGWPSPPDPGDLSRRVAQRRADLHLSQAQVAARTGLSLRYLEYLERYPARPTAATLRQLAAALRTTPAALLGAGAFVLVAGLGIVLMATDKPLQVTARVAQTVHNRCARRSPPWTGLSTRILQERDAVRAALGARWREASLATAGKLGFDYLSLLAALEALVEDAPSGAALARRCSGSAGVSGTLSPR